MGQVKVGTALLGAAMLAQLGLPAVSAAVDPVIVAVRPLSLLDAQETPPVPDDEPLDTEGIPGDGAGETTSAPDSEIPQAAPDTQAPVDDTEPGDQGSRPVEQPAPAPAPAPAPDPAPVAEPAPAAPVAEPVPVSTGPVAAEPVPAGPAYAAVDSYSSGDSYASVETAEATWPFMYGGSVFLNAGYGPGEANAAEGYDSCEIRTTNGRAYVGVHCSDGDLVAGFTPPPWESQTTPVPGSGIANTSGNDDFWSRVTGESGAIRVPVPSATTAAQPATVVEGRSRDRTKTVTVTRNGESETVTRSGRNNSSDTPSDSKNDDKNGKNDGKKNDNNNKNNNKNKKQKTAKQESGEKSGDSDKSAEQDLASEKKDRKAHRNHKPAPRRGVIETGQAIAPESPESFSACVQRSIQQPELRLDCSELISADIDAALEHDSGS